MNWSHVFRLFADHASAAAFAEAMAAALPMGDGDITNTWADPQPLADGRWVVVSVDTDAEALPWQADWALPEPEGMGPA